MDGLVWSIKQGKVIDVRRYTLKSGQPVADVKIAYFGGLTSIRVSDAEAKKFEDLKGKNISADGLLYVERSSFDGSDTNMFEIANIKAI